MTDPAGPLKACIFDVDGVLLASPHEQAWHDALQGITDPDRFTTALYQAAVAGKPRMDGARAALTALGVPDADRIAPGYAERKQVRLEELIHQGKVAAYPDALRFVRALLTAGWKMAAASSSKNAEAMLRSTALTGGQALFDAFGASVCGRDLPRGKPDPAIFLLAAKELGACAAHCFVAEDAPAGIRAARAGGFTALGLARHRDQDSLRAAGADCVAATFDDVSLSALAAGRMTLT